MSRMLAAQLYRLRHDKVVWGGLICMGFYALAVLGIAVNGQIRQGYQVALDQLVFYGYGLDSFIPVAGLVLSAVISFFTGTEYSDGTLRNALIVGRTRAEIYLSHVLVSLITALTYNLAYIVIVIVLGGPVFGGFHLSAAALALGILTGMLALSVYSALFTAVSLLCSSRTASAILCLSGVMLSMFLCTYLNMQLQEPPMMEVLEMRDGDSEVKVMENPRYLNPSQRKWAQAVIDVLPSGQSLQLGGLNSAHWPGLPPISLTLIVLVNGAGLIRFRRKDIK